MKEAGKKKMKLTRKNPNFLPSWVSDKVEDDQFQDKFVAAQSLLTLALPPAEYTSFMKQHYSGIKIR